MAHYLFSLKPILVVLILIIFIPVIIAQYGKKWIFSITEDVATPLKREKNYYMNCIVSKEYFKETRILGAFDFFINLFRETSNSINSLQHKANKKAAIINLVLQLASLGGYVGVLILLFNAVVDSKVSVGAFAAVFQGVTDTYKLLEEVVYSSIGGMIRDLGYIKNFTRFMNFDDSDKVTISSDLIMIELKSVNFKYPISNTDVVYTSLTFMHISDKLTAISKIAELLALCGRFVLSIDKKQNEYIDLKSRKIRVFPDNPEEICGYIKASNLKLEKQIETEFAYIIAAKK